MSYSTLEFLAFLLILIIVYYAVPKKIQWCVLLAASYTFYLLDGVKQVFFIIGTTIVTYAAARIIQGRRDRYKQKVAELTAAGELSREDKQQMKKNVQASIHKIQVIAVLIDLGILVAVKYLNFLLGSVNSVIGLFGAEGGIPRLNILVPLGVSFYTFQSMGYIIDVSRGKYDAEKNFGKTALFLSFFPSIIQGPINRYDDVGTQLNAGHKLEYNNLKFGAQLMMWGFFKKLVIADRIAPIVSTVFSENYDSYSGAAMVVGILAFTFQLYGDFSGGIDIARGAAQMLGINLPENFQRPYFSQTIAEFWRRWHMTLGSWMKDYVFYPIMLSGWIGRITKKAKNKLGNQAGKIIPSVITTFIVFFLIGIWHGATWQYVLYAIYNAIVVAGGVALEPALAKLAEKWKLDSESFSWKLFRMLRTFVLTCISKVLVCAPGVYAAGKIFAKILFKPEPGRLFGDGGELLSLGVDAKNLFVFGLSVVVLLVVSILQESGLKLRESLAKQNLAFRWTIYITALVVILVFGMYGPEFNAADFIYRQY